MRALLTAIPDVAVLLALEPEELSAKLLFLVRDGGSPSFHPDQMAEELWSPAIPEHQQYPRPTKDGNRTGAC